MRKQKRYTVRYAPATKTGKAMLRGMGLFHGIFGAIFVFIALTAIIPAAGPIGLLFLAGGAFFAVNGTLIALGKNGLGRSYQIESEEEFEPDSSSMPPVETHNHIPSTALDAKHRLEQLESLKSAGLITEQEYQQKRQEILRGL